jgi:predicted RNA-binding Zn ribbon-like protein
MLRVTWELIGIDEPALDVANTVAISGGVAHDLVASPGAYERWAAAAAAQPRLDREAAAVLLEARPDVLALREPIRAVLHAAAAGDSLPEAAVAELNRVSREAPRWSELDLEAVVHEHALGSPLDRLLGAYARSAMHLAAEGRSHLRTCEAPSCGMYYRPGRPQQRWCSAQCGTRARVARHYQPRRQVPIPQSH